MLLSGDNLRLTCRNHMSMDGSDPSLAPHIWSQRLWRAKCLSRAFKNGCPQTSGWCHGGRVHFSYIVYGCKRRPVETKISPCLYVNCSWGFVDWCDRVRRSGSVNQACSCHTHHTHADFTFLLLCSPLMWPSQPRDKWVQTWKTLRLAKNNTLSTDWLFRNANAKCSLRGSCTHFDMDSRREFLYTYLNTR